MSQTMLTMTDSTMQEIVMGTAAGNIPENAVFMAMAQASLRQLAGYIPPHCPLAAPVPDTQDDRPVIGARAQRILSLMLARYWQSAQAEFLAHVAVSGQRTPPEIAPLLLHMGVLDARLQPYLYAAMGARGKWLAQKISGQHWSWVKRAKNEGYTGLLTRDQWREKDIKSLIDDGLWFPVEQYQANHMGLFSDELSDYFIRCLLDTCRYQRYRDETCSTLWKILSYRIPLHKRETLLYAVEQLSSDILSEPETIVETLDFRQMMICAIYDRE